MSENTLEPPGSPTPQRLPASFFHSRWRGSVPLGLLLWRDMLLYGTTINVAAAFFGLVLFASNAPTALAATVYFAPVPFNVFLFVALWKTAAGAEEPLASTARIVGLLWLIAATII